MDGLVLSQRLLVNLGVAASNAGLYYSIESLAKDLDSCSFKNGSQFFATFSGDATSCRNKPSETFHTWPSGGNARFNTIVKSVILMQFFVQIALMAVTIVHYRMRIVK